MTVTTPTEAHESRMQKLGEAALNPSRAASRPAAGPLPLLPPNREDEPSSSPPPKRRVLRSLCLEPERTDAPPHESETSNDEEINCSMGVDEALEKFVNTARFVMALLEKHSQETFAASHLLLFFAYRFLKTYDRDPKRYERILSDAKIKPRKNTSLAKQSLRLALKQAGYAKATSTEHDWADWVLVMDMDGVPVTLDAVKTYRTEFALVSGGWVKGTDRLNARREELRAEERAKKRVAKQQRAAKHERETATAIQQGLSKRFVHTEWDGDSEDHTTGLDLLVIVDGVPAGLIAADEAERREFVVKHGLR